MGTECDLGLEFADNAICDVAVGTVGKLEEMLKTGSMIKWGRIVSSLSDKDLAVLSSGLTNRGRHFPLAGLADERVSDVVGLSMQLSADDIDSIERVANMIVTKWRKMK